MQNRSATSSLCYKKMLPSTIWWKCIQQDQLGKTTLENKIGRGNKGGISAGDRFVQMYKKNRYRAQLIILQTALVELGQTSDAGLLETLELEKKSRKLSFVLNCVWSDVECLF